MKDLSLDRRELLQWGATSLLCSQLSRFAFSKEKERDDPHFFLQIHVSGGLDHLYSFDARPLSMTEKKLQVNYMKEEPRLLTGRSGDKAWVTKLFNPLDAFWDRMCLINGVMMLTNFEGHLENENYLFTNNPFGGENFTPFLRGEGGKFPMTYISLGAPLFTTFTNAGEAIGLNDKSAAGLSKKLKSLPSLDSQSTLVKQLRARFERAQTNGAPRLAEGSKEMLRAMETMPQLALQLQGLASDQVPAPGTSAMLRQADLACKVFKQSIARAVLICAEMNGNVDCHDGKDAKAYPALMGGLLQDVANVLKHLRDTPFDSQRSFLDVTTVMLTTEMSRTMRSGFTSQPFEDQGTDHNPLKNSIMLAGKGIKGRGIVGASDLQSAEEVPSQAHQLLDKRTVQAMGRPFDFSKQHSSVAKPEYYRPTDYLQMPNVTNTIFSLFGVPAQHHLPAEPNGPAARALDV